MRSASYILTVALAAALLAGAVSADPAAVAFRTRQLLLKKAIDSKMDGTLVAELSRNRKAWGNKTPEQLRMLREHYRAFLKEDPARQANLIQAFEEFSKLSLRQRELYRQRAIWLNRVVSSLTQAEREALKKLPPDERAKRLLELKAKLVDKRPPAGTPTTTATE
jgi:hypothetical protein